MLLVPCRRVVFLETIREALEPLEHAIDIRLRFLLAQHAFDYVETIAVEVITPVAVGDACINLWLGVVFRVRHIARQVILSYDYTSCQRWVY